MYVLFTKLLEKICAQNVKQRFTTMCRCSNLDKLPPQNFYIYFLWSASVQHAVSFTGTATPHQEHVLMWVKITSFVACIEHKFMFRRHWTDATGSGWQSLGLSDGFKHQLAVSWEMSDIRNCDCPPHQWFWQIIINWNCYQTSFIIGLLKVA